MKKKWIMPLIGCLVIILAIYFLTQEKKYIETKKEIVEQNVSQSKNSTLSHEAKDAPPVIQQKSNRNLEEETFISFFPDKMRGTIERHQERQNDPTITLKISDLSPTEQALQKKWLKNYLEDSYILTSSVSFDYIQSQNKLIEFVEPDLSKISIPLLEISTTKLSEYEYLGKVLNTENTGREQNGLDSEIKRVYQGKNGQELFLLEKSVQNSKAILVDEFITEDIKGYPASRMTYCTEDQRCMSQITLVTKDKLYEVSTYGDQNSTKDELIEIISSFDLPELNSK